MKAGVIKAVTCQFAVSASIRRNAGIIRRYMQKAARARADVVHFPECALSGYVGTDLANFQNFDWEYLRAENESIMKLAAKVGIWVVLGSTHPPAKNHKPFNSLYLISPEGKIAGRYDKRFCTPCDLRRLTPGDHFVFFTINGVKCSLLICFDLRFPEIYRRLYKRRVNCIFQSFYNARQKGPSVHTHIMRQTMQCRAATNHFWASCSNASGYYSPYPSFFIRPDGVIVQQLKQNSPGIMINTVDLSRKFYDPMAGFRENAIAGKLSNRTDK